MAIPDVSEFQAWKKLARAPLDLPEEITASFDPHSPSVGTFSEAWATMCLEAIQKATEVALESLRAHSVSVWLDGQREYQRAERLVLVGRKTAGREITPRPTVAAAQTVRAWFDEALAHRRSVMLHHGSESHLRSDSANPHIAAGEEAGALSLASEDVRTHFGFVLRTSRGRAHGWRYSCVLALQEYYYGNFLGQDFAASKVSLDICSGLAAAAKEASTSMATLVKMLKDAEDLGFTKREINTRSMERYAKQLVIEAEKVSCPVHRRDVRSDERLFVFRLFRANRRVTRKPKAEAIVELMGLEGFDHQYDLRTVERICAGLADNIYRV